MDLRVKSFIEEHINDIENNDWKSFIKDIIYDLTDSHILEVFKSLKDAGIIIDNENIKNLFNSVFGITGEVIPLYNYNGPDFDTWNGLEIRSQINNYLLEKLGITIVVDENKYSLDDIKEILLDEYFYNVTKDHTTIKVKNFNLNFATWFDKDDNWLQLLVSVNIGQLTGTLYDIRLGVYIPGFGFMYNKEVFNEVVNKIKDRLK